MIDNFQSDLPVLIRDAKAHLNALGSSSSKIINPFDVLYKMVFQFTVREICCNDIANNPTLLNKMIHLFKTADSSFNPRIILFPSLFKLLSPAYWKQMIAGVRMYMISKDVVDQRKKTGERDEDPLQYLIDQGDSDGNLVQVKLPLFSL
jgi:hypothetical protein